MRSIREMKSEARRTVRKHYILLVFLTAMLVVAGGSTSLTREVVFHLNSPSDAQRLLNGGRFGGGTALSVAQDLYHDEFGKGYETAEEKIEKTKKRQAEAIGIGGSKGALSTIANEFSSGMILYRMAEAVQGIVHSTSLTVRILIAGAVLLYGAIWICLMNALKVIGARLILEARVYPKVPLSHALFLKHAGKWLHTAATLLRVSIYQALWNLTVIGGVIKHFSYLMVPYIAAENPAIESEEAIRLSRRMMDGHKLEVLRYQLTFLGWSVLGLLTLGTAEFLWAHPYCSATEAEIYADLRRLAIERGIEGAEQLTDHSLFGKAPAEQRTKAYADAERRRLSLNAHEEAQTGLRRFAQDWLGIWLGSSSGKIQFQQIEASRYELREELSAIDGESYPMRLAPWILQESGADSHRKHHFIRPIVWTRCYSVWTLVLMFFLFSFIGWCWEVSLHLITQHVFVNRGALHGPWLPIYGIGGVAITILLTRVRKAPAAEFCAAVLLAGIVEYSIARSLETGALHSRYWDYHGYFLNLDGRICAESILTFGVMGMLIVYVVAPLVDDWLSGIPVRGLAALSLALILLLAVDTHYSAAHPNGGSGVEQDITAGAWPTTLTRPDVITINGVVTHNTKEAVAAEKQ